MCGDWMSSTCRVCLASDCEMYRLANTALEETFERVTSDTLVVEGRPCCVCGVCLSALRRCRRFIDTAREANIALDRWTRNQPDTHSLELTKLPLFSFTRSPVKLLKITSQGIWESGVKQESETAENEDCKIVHLKVDDKCNILIKQIKYNIMNNEGNDNTHVSDDESDMTQMSNDKSIGSHSSELTHSEEIIDEIKPQTPQYDFSESLDNVGVDTTPGTSKIGRNHPKSQEDVPFQRSRKRIEPNEDSESGPVLKKRRPITSEHRRGNTDPPAVLIFSCLQCSYQNTNKSLLMAHLKIHTGKKPFLCDKCGYKCLKKGDLKLHIMIHTGEKPFGCNKCDLKFSSKYKLKQHSMVHTGVKPVSCEKCDYKCRDNGNLKRHLMSHTGEKPFICDKCDYRCIQKVSLTQHLKIHIEENPVFKKNDRKSKQKSNLK